jgi:hypothetical protein
MSPKGNHRTTAAQQADRQAQVIEKAAEGKTQGQIAAEVGASLATVKRDFKALALDFQQTTSIANAEFRRAQLAAFELIEQSLVQGQINSETANAWRGIRSEISKLLGLNAPERKVTAHVTGEHSRKYLLFRESVAGLDEKQLQEVYRFAKAIKRTWTPPPIEADFPPPMRALPEATDETD